MRFPIISSFFPIDLIAMSLTGILHRIQVIALYFIRTTYLFTALIFGLNKGEILFHSLCFSLLRRKMQLIAFDIKRNGEAQATIA